MTRRLLCALVLVSVALLACGCAYPLNAPADIVGATLPAIEAPGEVGMAVDEPPSVTSLDRSGWRLVRIVVPDRQVEHAPAYVSGTHYGYPTAYPTVVDALYAEEDRGQDAVEIFWQPVVTAAGVVLIPVDMVTGSAPWQAVRGPTRPDQLTNPRTSGPLWSWVSAPVVDDPWATSDGRRDEAGDG